MGFSIRNLVLDIFGNDSFLTPIVLNDCCHRVYSDYEDRYWSDKPQAFEDDMNFNTAHNRFLDALTKYGIPNNINCVSLYLSITEMAVRLNGSAFKQWFSKMRSGGDGKVFDLWNKDFQNRIDGRAKEMAKSANPQVKQLYAAYIQFNKDKDPFEALHDAFQELHAYYYHGDGKESEKLVNFSFWAELSGKIFMREIVNGITQLVNQCFHELGQKFLLNSSRKWIGSQFIFT